MKGMLIKDFCILKLQKNAVLVLLAMCVVFTVFMKSPTYIVNLFPMYGFLLVLGTLHMMNLTEDIHFCLHFLYRGGDM